MRNYHSVLRRMVLVTFVCGAALIGLTGTASAHAQLEGSDPPAGSVLPAAPQRVALSFGEPVEVAPNAIEVFDDHLERVSTAAVTRVAEEGNRIQVGLPSNLRIGTYTVSWHVSSTDTHPVSGTFRFSIGTTSQVTGTVPDTGRNDSAGFLLGMMRSIGYGGLVLGPGVLLVSLALWPAGLASRRTRITLYLGLGLLGVSALGSMLLQGVWASGRPLSAMWSAPTSLDTHSRKFDTLYALRFYLLVAFGVLLVATISTEARSAVRTRAIKRAPAPVGADRRGKSTGPQAGKQGADKRGPAKPGTANPATARPFASSWPGIRPHWLMFAGMTVGTLALMLTWSLAGHAAAGLQPAVAVGADLLHILAMTVWLGGLVLLNVSLRPADRVADLAAVLPRFSRLAFGCVAVLAVTGSYQSWREVGSFDALFATTFGRVLMLKLAAVAVVLVLGNLARLWVRRHLGAPGRNRRLPRLMAPRATAHAADAATLEEAPRPAAADARSSSPTVAEGYGPPELRRLRRSLISELAIAFAVLGVTAALVVSVPSRQAYIRPFRQTLTAAHLQVSVRVDAPRTGDTVLHLAASTPDGKAVAVSQIRGSLSQPGLGPLPLRLPNPAGATVTGKEDIGLTFPRKGEWKIQLTVQTSKLDATAFVVTLPVA